MVFDQYAAMYDIIYQNKPYMRECRYLASLFEQYRKASAKSVLDCGCGTGNYALRLMKLGYKVSGFDLSAQMLSTAAQKLDQSNFTADLKKASLTNFEFSKKFDVIICMFSVLNYLTTTRAMNQALVRVREHLKKDSLFIFDVWNKAAVEKYYSPQKRQEYVKGSQKVTRCSKTKLSKQKQLCEVKYECSLFEGKKKAHVAKETHQLKYYSIEQTNDLLTRAGFKVLNTHPFLKPEDKVKENTWDVTFVCQKI